MSLGFRSRSLLSLAVAGAILSAFCINGFAFSGAQANTPIGVLTSSGSVSLNGNKALSGASLFSGNTISTGPDGAATLDLRQFGRVVVRPNTAVTITVVGQSIQVSDNGKSVLVVVMSGSAQVVSPQGNRSLNVSQQNTFTGPVQITMAPGSVIVVENGNNRSKGAAAGAGATKGVSAPLWGFLILGGVAGGIAAGVATHGGEKKPAAATVSPSVP